MLGAGPDERAGSPAASAFVGVFSAKPASLEDDGSRFDVVAEAETPQAQAILTVGPILELADRVVPALVIGIDLQDGQRLGEDPGEDPRMFPT